MGKEIVGVVVDVDVVGVSLVVGVVNGADVKVDGRMDGLG